MAATENEKLKELVQSTYNHAAKLLAGGQSEGQVVANLEEQGVPRELAEKIVSDLAEPVARAKRSAAHKNMMHGGLWCVGGLLVTGITYSAASGGGSYVVTWGAIVFGAIQFFRGLSQLPALPPASHVPRRAGVSPTPRYAPRRAGVSPPPAPSPRGEGNTPAPAPGARSSVEEGRFVRPDAGGPFAGGRRYGSTSRRGAATRHQTDRRGTMKLVLIAALAATSLSLLGCEEKTPEAKPATATATATAKATATAPAPAGASAKPAGGGW
jgi:hypothetical protein